LLRCQRVGVDQRPCRGVGGREKKREKEHLGTREYPGKQNFNHCIKERERKCHLWGRGTRSTKRSSGKKRRWAKRKGTGEGVAVKFGNNGWGDRKKGGKSTYRFQKRRRKEGPTGGQATKWTFGHEDVKKKTSQKSEKENVTQTRTGKEVGTKGRGHGGWMECQWGGESSQRFKKIAKPSSGNEKKTEKKG